MGEQAIGIKETMEVLAGIEVLAMAGKSVMADGKIDLSDAQVLFALLAKQADLMAAFDGAAGVVEEMKDLDGEEFMAIGKRVVDMIAAFRAA
jgi:hypothetical protein